MPRTEFLRACLIRRTFWVKKEAYLESLTATFINRNTAGAYFGSCAVIWLLLLLEQMRRQMPPGLLVWREVAERVLSAPPRVVAVAFVMFCLCLLAMFMTGSRAASILSLAALVLWRAPLTFGVTCLPVPVF
jgi:hypothetical protein